MLNNIVNICSLSKEDDLGELISLSKEFLHEYESHHEDFFGIDNLTDNNIIEYFNRFIGAEDRKAFIARADGTLVGYITVYVHDQPSFWKIKKVGDISGLMVRKEFRRQGIASQLLNQATDFFKEKGVKYYTVFTSVNNQLGLEFYQQNGMVPLYTTLVGEIVKN